MPPTTQASDTPGSASSLLPRLVLAVTVLALLAWLFHLERGTAFFRDEWAFVLYRQGQSPTNFLAPHAGNLSAVPVAAYVAVFRVFGLDDYWVLRVLHLAVLGLAAILLHAWAARRVGPWAALAPVVLILTLGSSWDDLLWPFQLGYAASLAGGLAALLLLERPWVGRPRRSDALAASSLLVAVGSSSLGLAFCAAGAAAVLTRARDRTRALLGIAAVAAIWLAWYVKYGRLESRFKASELPDVPGRMADGARSAMAGLTGLGLTTAGVLVLALIGAAAFRAWRDPDARRDLAVPVILGLAFWGLVALAPLPGSGPMSSRYVLPGALALLLTGAAVVRGLAMRPVAGLVLAALVVVLARANATEMSDAAGPLRATGAEARARLSAVETAGASRVVGSAAIINAYGVDAVGYLYARDYWGSSAAGSVDDVRAGGDEARGWFDETLIATTGLALTPTTSRGRLECSSRRQFDLPATGALLQARATGGEVGVRRLASTWTTLGTVGADSVVVLRQPRDALSEPWRVRLGAGVESCVAASRGTPP